MVRLLRQVGSGWPTQRGLGSLVGAGALKKPKKGLTPRAGGEALYRRVVFYLDSYLCFRNRSNSVLNVNLNVN